MPELVELRQEPSEADIEAVEGLLEAMKAGKVTDFGFLWHQIGGEIHSMYQARNKTMSMIGELRCLERDLIDGCVDTRFHAAGEQY